MDTYQIKKLIPGHLIGAKFAGLKLIAIPDKFIKKPLRVILGSESRIILEVGEEALAFRKFKDKFGRAKDYTLIYYEWK